MSTIPTKDLYNYLPHKPPMVWIDTVVSFSDNGGETTTDLKSDGVYFTEGRLRPSSFIEFTAQAYAFVNLAYLRAGGENDVVHSKTYLASIKDFVIHGDIDLKPGTVVTTRVRKTRTFGPITVVKGECFVNSTLVTSCDLKVFSE